MDMPYIADVSALVRERRITIGPEFVSGRVDAENRVRDLLDDAGELTEHQARELLVLFKTQVVAGREHHNRFGLTFRAGAVTLVRNMDVFNDRLQKLWKGDEETALHVLDETLKTRSSFPGAGSSLPSMLLYLRDPTRHAIWIGSTIDGLHFCTGAPRLDTTGGVHAYRAFCTQAHAFRAQYALKPQELDAVLAEATRLHSEGNQPAR